MSERTIVQKGDVLQKEAVAAAGSTIYPGDILEKTSAGTIQEHSVAGGDVRPLKVAIEDALQGNEVSEVYTAGNVVQYVTPKSGDEVLLRLALGQTVVIGDKLISAGSGFVKKYTAHVDSSVEGETEYVDPIVGEALEAGTTPTAVDYILVEVA